jgi:regulator of RNase E activity RraA
MRSVKRGEGTRDVPVEVRGARIEPGMRVVVDEDGVLVLPAG